MILHLVRNRYDIECLKPGMADHGIVDMMIISDRFPGVAAAAAVPYLPSQGSAPTAELRLRFTAPPSSSSQARPAASVRMRSRSPVAGPAAFALPRFFDASPSRNRLHRRRKSE
jgi:hypothetical protein